MEKSQTSSAKPGKRWGVVVLSGLVLLCIPLVAMQFSDDVNWTLTDFVAAAVLLSGAGLALELIRTKVQTTKHRLIAVVALLAVLLLIWAELAVGVLGTPWAGS